MDLARSQLCATGVAEGAKAPGVGNSDGDRECGLAVLDRQDDGLGIVITAYLARLAFAAVAYAVGSAGCMGREVVACFWRRESRVLKRGVEDAGSPGVAQRVFCIG